MPRVRLWGSLREAAGGRDAVHVDADSIGAMLRRLEAEHPGLRPQLKRGVAVSVDGAIFRDNWLAPVAPDSEVFLLPKLAGG